MNADILDNKFLNSIINTSVCMHMFTRAHTQTEGFTTNVISGGITMP
jgi:hypothetical protein